MSVFSDNDCVEEIETDSKTNTRASESKTPSSKFRGSADANSLLAKNPEGVIKTIDPLRCKPWKYHNRDTAWLTKEYCQDLIFSIQHNGQNEPILVRKIPGDPQYDFEIIYGVRRWYACLQIPNQKLLATVTEADDKTCMILMHTENADSKDISEYERACSFAQQFKAGIFKNQTEMAKAMGVTQGLISRMIKAAELFEYDWIKRLFPNKLEIRVKPAYKLATLLKDPSQKVLIQNTAQEIETKIQNGAVFTPRKILKMLLLADASEGALSKKNFALPIGNDRVISCKRDAQGKITIAFDARVRASMDKEALLGAIEKALEQFVVA